ANQSSYGIALDRDGNVWFGGTAARYSPNRNGTFADLGSGSWTLFAGITSAGVAVDARSANGYFAWFAGNSLVEIPASAIPPIPGQDQVVDRQWTQIPVFGGGAKGVGIAP